MQGATGCAPIDEDFPAVCPSAGTAPWNDPSICVLEVVPLLPLPPSLFETAITASMSRIAKRARSRVVVSTAVNTVRDENWCTLEYLVHFRAKDPSPYQCRAPETRYTADGQGVSHNMPFLNFSSFKKLTP